MSIINIQKYFDDFNTSTKCSKFVLPSLILFVDCCVLIVVSMFAVMYAVDLYTTFDIHSRMVDRILYIYIFL